MRCLALLALWVGALCAHPELRRILTSGTVHDSERQLPAASFSAFGISVLILAVILVPGLLLGARWIRGQPFHVALGRTLVLVVAGCAAAAAAFGARSSIAQAHGWPEIGDPLGTALYFAVVGVGFVPVVAWWVILPMALVTALVLRAADGPAASRAGPSTTPPASPPSAAAPL